MQIVLCDDDRLFEAELEARIRQLCEAHGIRVSSVKGYTSSKELMEDARDLLADPETALFLDIDMPALSGFDVARQIQQEPTGCRIVFVTQKDELVFQSLSYHPFFFLRKAHLDEELEGQLLELDRLLNPRWTMLPCQEGRDAVEIPLETVRYAEGEKNYLALHGAEDRVFRVRMKLADAEKQWQRAGFLRPHKGFLVNYRFIERVNADNLLLTTGQVLPVGRRYQPAFRDALLEVVHHG